MRTPKTLGLALLVLTLLLYAQATIPEKEPAVTPGTKATYLYAGAYPNALVGVLYPDHWPFPGPAPPALVAVGSPVYGDYYNLTNQLRYLLNITDKTTLANNYPGYKKVIQNTGGATPGIGIGFTALGEFVAVLNNGVGGGLAVAPYNRPDVLSITESWATQGISYINPSDWLNGWTLSANLTIPASDLGKYYYIFIHAFAVYSNRTHAGGGRGVAFNITMKDAPQKPAPYPVDGKQWILLPFTSSDYKMDVLYDSPRLLIAKGYVTKTIDLGTYKPDLMGASVTIRVDWTLIFPKAWNYAIVYYNYTVKADMASKLLPFPMYLNGTAFSIRFEIDQISKGPDALTSNATIFNRTTCKGTAYQLLHATPAFMNNITMFAAVYPVATQYTPYGLAYLVPYRLNNFGIVLPPNKKETTISNKIPFVIFQWYKNFTGAYALPGKPYVYSNGTMFVYGYAYNLTEWARNNKPDVYIESLVNKTVFELPTLQKGVTQCFNGGAQCSTSFRFKYGVVGSMADPTDVLAAMYVSVLFNNTYSALDIAPNAFQNLYTGYSSGGMSNFVKLWNFGGIPHILAIRNASFPYFYDRYLRFSIDNASLIKQLVTPRRIVIDASYTTMFTVGGPFVNMLTRYVQDFAWYVPFTSTYTAAPYPFNFSKFYKAMYDGFVISVVWNNLTRPAFNTQWPPRPGAATGLAVVSTAVDPNGTVILQVWGMNTQDTYWGAFILKKDFGIFTDAPAYIIIINYDGTLFIPQSYRLVKIWTYQRPIITPPVTQRPTPIDLPNVSQGLN